jgi:hypothetical protein
MPHRIGSVIGKILCSVIEARTAVLVMVGTRVGHLLNKFITVIGQG